VVLGVALVGLLSSWSDIDPAAGALQRSALPLSIAFDTVSVEHGHLQVSGSIDSGARCAAATLDATTLTITRIVEEACGDPALSGEQVGPSQFATSTGEGALRIARSDPLTGAVTYGPVLFSYEETSGTHPEVAYDGNGSMWVYEPDSTTGPVAVRVSATTGTVLQTARFSMLGRSLIVADRDGLFLAPAVNSLGKWNGIVYEVPVGSTSDKVVDPAPNYEGYVPWLTASDETVWVAACDRGPSEEQPCTVSRFSGAGFTRTLERPLSSPGPVLFDGEQLVGSPTEGYFGTTMSSATPSSTSAIVVRVDPATGSISTIGALTQNGFGDGVIAGDGAVFDGALYVLNGRLPTSPATVTRIPL